MSREQIITAIDVGTDKCVTLIATYSQENPQLRVVGVSAVASNGVRKSQIVDLEAVLHSIGQSLDAAERMAGFSVQSAYVSVAGIHIRSKNSKGVVAVANPDQEITKQDVERVIEAARAVSIPSDRQIIHVIPRYFKVDSQEDIRDPVGMTGVRLESEAHIITGLTTSLRNLEKCLNDLGIMVEGFVFSSLAAANVTLSETEKELGVVAVDVGAGTTSLCAFVEGALEYSGSIPVGARHITQDVALGCRISLDNAEKIKLHLTEYGLDKIKPRPGESKRELTQRRKKADKLNLEQLGIQENVEELTKSTITKGIIHPRVEEIVTMIGEKLEERNLLGQVPAGLVISGGGAQTIGLIEVARKVLALPARVGYPQELSGLVGDIKNPSYATGVGLLVYGKGQGASQVNGSGLALGDVFKDLKLGKLFTKFGKLFKSLLP